MSKPIWQKNLLDAMHLDPLIVLHGNVKDLYALPFEMHARLPASMPRPPYVNFDIWLALHFEALGYPVVILYDPVDGAVCLRGSMVDRYQKLALRRQDASDAQASPAAKQDAPVSNSARGNAPSSNAPPKSSPALPKSQPTSEALGQTTEWLCRLKTFQKPEEFFRTLYEQVLPQIETPVAVVCRFMDRYLSFTDRQDQDERRLSLLIQKAALAIPRPLSSKQLSSRIALVFDSEGGVPQELNTLAPFAKSVRVPVPTLEERETFFRDNHAAFDQTTSEQHVDPTADPAVLRMLANLSEGLRMQDLLSLVQLSQREQLGLATNHFKELLDRFKFGTRENAWVKIKQETLINARTALTARVKGQDEVIAEVLPVLIRAKLGMTDLSTSQFSSKPRGV